MNKFNTNILQIVAFIAFIMLMKSCASHKKEKKCEYAQTKPISVNFTPKDTTWKSLSLREKIGQTMIIRVYYEDHIKDYGSIAHMMKKYPVGGIFLPDWKFLEIKPRKNVIPSIKNRVSEYENASKYPLIVTEDFERGVGSTYFEYTPMPALMALGAANNSVLAEKFGNAIAKEASSLGASMLKDKEALGLWTMGMLPQEKIIAISYSNPYYVNFYFDNASIRINAYSIDRYSQKAVVDALTGVIPFKGTSPVRLDHQIMK